MEVSTSEMLLATANPPSVYNFYPNSEAAVADMDRVKASGYPNVELMTWDAFVGVQRAFYLGDPAREIDAKFFHQSLEVLPPMAWRSNGSFESFLMCEFTSGSYTSQYAHTNADGVDRYFTKTVDARDKTSWMTFESCAKL